MSAGVYQQKVAAIIHTAVLAASTMKFRALSNATKRFFSCRYVDVLVSVFCALVFIGVVSDGEFTVHALCGI